MNFAKLRHAVMKPGNEGVVISLTSDWCSCVRRKILVNVIMQSFLVLKESSFYKKCQNASQS